MITAIVIVFVVGYLAIALEHNINLNKSASALVTGVLLWTLYIVNSGEHHLVNEQLTEYLGEVSGILFFLLGAMTIVELIDAHDGFEVITQRIKTTSSSRLLWILSILAFFLSSVLDNLTTTIVMISLLRKILPPGEKRLYFVSMIVIAANAGGAWSPIGDVTTTMLWIGGQMSASAVITGVFIPSIICLVVPLMLLAPKVKGVVAYPEKSDLGESTPTERTLVFWIGVIALISVPVFKTLTHLPPYMGILIALGVMWVITEIIHKEKDEADKDKLSVVHALRKIDVPSILFFLGILLAIGVLQHTGVLRSLAGFMDSYLGNINIVVITIGVLSAIIDNVPLVAAAQGMYDLSVYPQDHYFWEFLAYCAGTGGSALIIGSAAGVAAMGMEKINFMWYLKKITWLALAGFFAGAVAYIIQHAILHL